MHLADAGLPDERGHVVGADAAAGHHHQRVAGTRHHARDRRRAGRGGVGAARRQHAIDAEGQQRVEGFERIARRVDRLVTRDRQWPCAIDQPAHDIGVDRRIGPKRAEHDAVRAGRDRRPDVRLHRRDLAGVVDEVAAARADHHEHRDGQRCGAAFDQRGVGRGAAHVEAGAQLDAARSPARRRQRGVVRIDAGLEQRRHARSIQVDAGAIRPGPAGRASRRPAPGRARETAPAPHRAGGWCPPGRSDR